MTTNSVLCSGIRGLVALDLDGTAVSQKVEVMSWFFVAKSHAQIAASIHARKVDLLTRRTLLRNRTCANQTEEKEERSPSSCTPHNHFPGR